MTGRLRNTSGLRAIALTAGLVIGGPQAWGDGDHGHGPSEIGEPGTGHDATRTINVVMGDSYFEPTSIPILAGETVRFRIENAGELVHEFNIGTASMHAAHQEEMIKMMERGVLGATEIKHEMMSGSMMHDDPNSVLLEPGESGDIVWIFTTNGELEFACNVPGHYEAGMIGTITVANQD